MRRKWITLLRIARYGLSNFSRNAWLTTAATAVMVVTLTLILSVFTARMVFADTITKLREKIDVSVYLKDGISEDDRQTLINEIKKVPIVTSVDYITKEQAREKFKEQNKAYYEQLQALGELGNQNPLPASLRVHTKDPNKLDDIRKVVGRADLKKLQSDEPSISGERRQAIDNIARAAQFSEIAGLVASTIFLTLSIMIIFNTIRMAIFNRRDEIEIMKLIGAEKSFIRGPFIVEAALYGIVAAVISVTLVYFVLWGISPYVAKVDIEIDPTIRFFVQWPGLIFLGQLFIGIMIGIISSLLAMRRYLKV